MRKNCSECKARLADGFKETISSAYSSETKTLIVTKVTTKKCIGCGKLQRVLPIEVTAQAKVLNDGSIEVKKC